MGVQRNADVARLHFTLRAKLAVEECSLAVFERRNALGRINEPEMRPPWYLRRRPPAYQLGYLRFDSDGECAQMFDNASNHAVPDRPRSKWDSISVCSTWLPCSMAETMPAQSQ